LFTSSSVKAVSAGTSSSVGSKAMLAAVTVTVSPPGAGEAAGLAGPDGAALAGAPDGSPLVAGLPGAPDGAPLAATSVGGGA
jgi:hypothetical protein